MGEIDCNQPALGIGPRLVADFQIVAFAGDDHIIIAVIEQFAGLTRGMGRDRTGHGQRIALAFLAAKAAAHPAHFHPHR
jgi:hypothetical protein